MLNVKQKMTFSMLLFEKAIQFIGILNSEIDAFIANTSPEFLIRKNFHWIDAKTNWVNLLRNIDIMKDHIILVTNSMIVKTCGRYSRCDYLP